MRRRSAVVLATVLSTTASAASAQTFNFDTTPVGTAAPFSISSGGVTATFASAANFTVQPTFFSGLTGRVLFDNDVTVAPLTISFNTLLTGVSLRLGANSPLTAAAFTLQARNGATLVGTVNVAGTVPPGFLFPEGALSFAGATFDSLVLSSTARDFAVDNIVVTTSGAVVPEPATVALVGIGMLVVSAVAARRRSTAG
jgi:hypothetical protein